MASSLSKEKNCGHISSLVNRTIKLAQNAPTRLKVFLLGEVGVNFLGSLSCSLSKKERGGSNDFHPSKVGLLTKVNAIPSPLFEVGGSIQRLH